MKVATFDVYEFSELSDEAKQEAIKAYSEINTGYDWWDMIYMDASSSAGIIISGFDIYSGQISGTFESSASDTAKAIISEYSEDAGIVVIANTFLRNKAVLEVKMVLNKDIYTEDDDDELDQRFLNVVLAYFLGRLKGDYEYNESDEGIIDTIEANEYWFTEEGKPFYETWKIAQ